MQPSLTVTSLTKRFGTVTAVDGLSFSVEPGAITALIGPNGSGKSTTMRCALGLVHPTAGGVRVNGGAYADLRRPLTHVGALLDANAVTPGLSGRDHLRWLAAANGIDRRRADALLALVGLAAAARRKVGTYSLGMKQRLGVAASLVGDPPILIFDEPMNGLDPEGMVWLRGLLRAWAAEGRIVLLSSHLMGELEGIADRLVIINRGRLLRNTTVGELLGESGGGGVTVHTRRPADAMAVLAAAGATVTSTDRDALDVAGLDAEHVAALLAANGIAIRGLSATRPSLELKYLDLTGGAP